jgi:hypothetical protein
MNKIIILITTGLIIFSAGGCKSFKKYFNPPPKKTVSKTAKQAPPLTPYQKRQLQLKKTVFSPTSDKGPKKTNLNSSLNSYEQKYLNEVYKEQDSEKKKKNVFKLF